MRILFVAFPAEGHLRPLLPLALAAVEAGHHVIVATGPDGVPVAASSGLATMEVGMSIADWRVESVRRLGPPGEGGASGGAMSAGREGWRRAVAAFALVYAPTMVDEIMESIGQWKPDLIVYEMAALAGAVAGRMLGVPCVTHGYGVLRPVEALEAFDRAAAPLWEQYSVPAPKWVGLMDHPYLDPIPSSLQAPHAAVVPQVQSIRTVERPLVVSRADNPCVYITFGTIFADRELFRTVLTGIARSGVDVIATVGHRIDPHDLGSQPDNVRIERFVPQAHILGRVSAVVCHAGSGSLLGALAAGTPLVLVPQGADHFWNAEACCRAGAGVMVEPPDVSPESITHAVQSVLEDRRYAERASELATEMAAMPSPRECLTALESRLAG